MNSNNQNIKLEKTPESQLEISLSDFPDDIYILLKDDFRANFFKTAWKINRSYRHLAKKVGVSNTTMLSFRRGKDTAGLEKGISIKHLKKIIEFSQDSPLWTYTLDEVQKNIFAIKARAGKLKIYNPPLPILGSIKLREIVTHLLCDGSALIEKHATSKYASSSLETVKRFKENLSIFGNNSGLKIRTRIYPNHYLNCYSLHFSKAITKILSNKFKISFRGKEARFPPKFFEGDEKLLIATVRTFIIDEGCIQDRSVSCCSGSLGLVEDLRLICNKLGYQCQKIKKSDETYYLRISPNSFKKVYEDIMTIGQLPDKNKQEFFDLGMKILNNTPDFLNLNKEILELLKNKPLTKLDLAKILLVNTKTIGQRLLTLEKQNIVRRFEEKSKGRGGAFVWTIN